MIDAEFTSRLKRHARQEGFDAVAVCPAVTLASVNQLAEWLQRGYAGEMSYIADRQTAYEHPSHVLDGVRSIVMLTMNYRTADANPTATGQGRISRYAWGAADYHDVIHGRLKSVIRWIGSEYPDSRNRGVVDTAPLLERQFAQLAGLGWQGKNTLLLNREAGSLFFLAALLTDLELQYDQPYQTDHCGTCTACLDACPTHAFPKPYVLDASRCISYLTIELRNDIPQAFRHNMDGWLFGCDVCQDVCPWNRQAPKSDLAEFQPTAGSNPVELRGLFQLNEDGFRERFRTTPLWRSKRSGILRNAAILLGAQGHQPATPELIGGLSDDEPLVRAACAWALGQLGTEAAQSALRQRQAVETHDRVAQEIRSAVETV